VDRSLAGVPRAGQLVVILTSIFFGLYLYSIDLVLNRLAGLLFDAFD